MTRLALARRSATVVAAAALVLAGSGAIAAPSASPPANDQASNANLAPGLLRAMERDLGLDATQARTRLAFQDDAAAVQASLENELGDAFAGAWVDEDANVLHVGTTDATTAAAVRAKGAKAVTVDNTLAQLEGWEASLDSALKGNRNINAWYVDVTTNSVVVDVRSGHLPDATRAVTRTGVPADAVKYVQNSEAPRTFIDVVGGNAYYIGGNTRCSVGFSVVGGFITAGHCGTVGARTTSPTGTFAGSRFPGNDWAWVQVAAGNTPVGAVNNYAGGRVAITGSTPVPVGGAVCRSGSTSGWHCGTVQALNSSVTYPQGTITGLIRTNVCAEPGDSGGSLVAGSQAQGVTSGGSGNCTSGGTTYFQPVNPILSTFGLTLVTSGGTPPTTKPPTTPPTTKPPTTPPTTPPGQCAAAWRNGVVYVLGNKVSYAGKEWTAKWWTNSDVPGADQWGPWTVGRTC